MSDRITLRKWRRLPFRDARTCLIGLGTLQARMDKKGLSPTVDDLRSRAFREHLHLRQAALFAYFIGQAVLKVPVAYALIEEENEDYDCVMRWRVERRNCYVPVQLKEIVPQRRNPESNLNAELSKLGKYVSSQGTVVAVHLNRSGLFDRAAIKVPETTCAQLWLYGALTADQSRWFLFGNLLAAPVEHEISFPT